MNKLYFPFKNKILEFLLRDESGYDVTVTDRIVIQEIFMENVYQVNESDILDSHIVIDIGANIGAFSMMAAVLGAKVYSYEPDPQNFSILKQNIANNRLNIVAHEQGVYNKRGSCELWLGQGASFIEGSKIPTPEAQRMLDSGTVEKKQVPVITLEDVYSFGGFPYCDVLKIDAESAEYKILEASSEIVNKARYITMEFHATDEITFGKMIAKLSLTHNLHLFGKYDVGGQLYGRRY